MKETNTSVYTGICNNDTNVRCLLLPSPRALSSLDS